LEIYQQTKISKIQDFEVYASYIARSLDIAGSFCYNNEPLRGQYHYDSIVYPYVATAVSGGKWDLKAYKKELGLLLEEYDIDPESRGKHD
jgi:hypothetical protein